MAKKKKARRPPDPPSLKSLADLAPEVINNFRSEIEYLLAQVPGSIWQEQDTYLSGLMYDFLPWHDFSSIAIQTRNDDRFDPASWTYYDCASSDCSRIQNELQLYRDGEHKLWFHWLLIQAAEALLAVDLASYGQLTIEEGFPYGPFRLQVYDPDESFRFNYCEYALARRLDDT